MGYVTFTVYDGTTSLPISGAAVTYTVSWVVKSAWQDIAGGSSPGGSKTTTILTDAYGNASFFVNPTPPGAQAYSQAVQVSANGYDSYSNPALQPWTGNGSLAITINIYPTGSAPKEKTPLSPQTTGYLEWIVILGILVTIIIVFLYLRSRKPKGPTVPQNVTYKTYHMQ